MIQQQVERRWMLRTPILARPNSNLLQRGLSRLQVISIRKCALLVPNDLARPVSLPTSLVQYLRLQVLLSVSHKLRLVQLPEHNSTLVLEWLDLQVERGLVRSLDNLLKAQSQTFRMRLKGGKRCRLIGKA
jgi:hypothetical protein